MTAETFSTVIVTAIDAAVALVIAYLGWKRARTAKRAGRAPDWLARVLFVGGLVLAVMTVAMLPMQRAPSRGSWQWQRFVSPDGQFEVTFPGAPESTLKTTPTAAGDAQVRVFHAERGGRTFSVSHYSYTSEQIEAGVRPSVDALGERIRQTTGIEPVVTVESQHGEDYAASLYAPGLERYLRMRVVARGPDLFMIQVAGSSETAMAPEDERFLTSMVLRESAGSL